jgi:hypothetical protein
MKLIGKEEVWQNIKGQRPPGPPWFQGASPG